MDYYAMSRVCSAYMEEYTSHMLSKNIATNIASLNEDGPKHSITYECVIDEL
jgi:exoribonuclease R